MSTLCTVCNHYECPGCLGAARDEVGRLKDALQDATGHSPLFVLNQIARAERAEALLQENAGKIDKMTVEVEKLRHALVTALEDVKRGLDGNEKLMVEMAAADRWIAMRSEVTDHACAQCVPGGSAVVFGFICGWHAARYREMLRAGVFPSKPGSEPKRGER